jgi:hypothetical protein
MRLRGAYAWGGNAEASKPKAPATASAKAAAELTLAVLRLRGDLVTGAARSAALAGWDINTQAPPLGHAVHVRSAHAAVGKGMSRQP